MSKPAGQVVLVAVAGLLSVALGSGCRGDRWEGFVYPSKDDLTDHRALGEFTSLEACRRACLTMLSDLHAADRGDYECGKNCKPMEGMTVRICEETVR